MRQILNPLFAWRRLVQHWVMVLALLILVTPLTQPAMAIGIQDIPDLKADQSTWVVDQADVLSLINKGDLEDDLSDLAKETGNQVRMVILRRLDYGETPESLSKQIFEKWFPTPEAQANQALILLDTKTNNTAIRTGNQVKKIMPNQTAESVTNETMRIPISKGNYNQALLDASDRLTAVLSGRPDPGPPEVKIVKTESTYKTAEETDDKSATIWVIGLLLAATVIPMVTYYIYQGQG